VSAPPRTYEARPSARPSVRPPRHLCSSLVLRRCSSSGSSPHVHATPNRNLRNYSASGSIAGYCVQHVCLSVRTAHSYTPGTEEPRIQTVPNFVRMLPVAVTRFSFAGFAIYIHLLFTKAGRHIKSKKERKIKHMYSASGFVDNAMFFVLSTQWRGVSLPQQCLGLLQRRQRRCVSVRRHGERR